MKASLRFLAKQSQQLLDIRQNSDMQKDYPSNAQHNMYENSTLTLLLYPPPL